MCIDFTDDQLAINISRIIPLKQERQAHFGPGAT